MKQTWKRLLSLLLACVLVVSALPLSASAQVSEPSAATMEWVSGICQNNYSDYDFGEYFQLGNSGVYWASAVKYQQTAEGVVTDTVLFIVPGEGATGEDAMMPDYNSTPELWAHGNVSALYIGDGVAGIGDYAFYNIPTLEKVVIEDSADLTKVGEHAFDGCDNLVGPLDLSNVTTLGQYAFNNCERLGSGENNTGVTLSDNLTEIPKNAFYNCALKKVNIPESCTEIGEGAFAHNSLSAVGELVLPDDLQSIGDSAFYRQPSESTTMQGITSLVIPASVTYIGENAFYGIKSLSQVELKRTTAEGLEIENGAFGINPMTAYNTTKTYEIEGIKYENVSVGAEFLTNGDVGDLLENGVNCYLGDLKPLEYKGTVKPTCEEPGYHVYIMTLEGVTAAGSTESKDVEVETEIEIPAVRHDYVQQEDEPATCELPARKHWKCMNVENGKVEKCETPDRYEEITGSMPLGHNYQVTNVENPLIAGDNKGNTVITYTCANAEKELHDGDLFPSYSWEIKPTTAIASTSNTLREVQLPQVSGSSGNHYTAELQWNEDEDKLDELLTDGENEFNVKLVVTSTTNSFPPYTSEDFKLKVQVDKVRLDFSDVQFQNNIRYVAQNNGTFGVRNLPDDANITKTEYSKDGQKWETTAPADTEENKGNYQVRVTFTYTSSKYLLDTGNSDLLPPKGYTLAEGETPGIGTITGPYEIKQLTAADLRVSPIENLTYDGEKHNTVQIDGVPVGADVTVQWKNQEGNPQTETYKAEATSMSVAGITNAGTYDVTITVKHGTFTGGSATKEAQGVIAKREIPTPKANRLQAYTPELTQTGVADPTGEYVGIYTVENNKQINAGPYEATATLADSNNYKWSTSDEAEVKISYTIPRRPVYKPTRITEAYTYDGGTKMPLTGHNGTNMEGKFDDDGTLTAYWKAYPSYTVFTATYAQMTDAGDYTITVSLNNTEGAQNYQWSNPSAQEPDVADFTIKWRIIPAEVPAPEVTVANATYDGQPYNTDGTDITLTGQSDILMLGADHEFYNSSSSQDAIATPVDAGTYWVAVDFDFAGDKKESNYRIIGNPRESFTISKAILTLTAPGQEKLTETYTGQAIPVPAPEIGSYPEHGVQNATLTYTYKLKDSGDEAKTAEGKLELTNVGTYTITVKVSDSCQNYTSDTETYEFTITAADQTVKLTSETDGWNADNSTVSKTLGDDPFTVTGTGYVGENPTTSKITYAVTESNASDKSKEAVVKVDANSGEVTLLRAGSATITVTAASSDNYDEATATYTITVGKGTPTIQASNKEIAYDGATLELSDYQATVSGVSGAVDPSEELSYQFYESEEAATQGSDDGKIGIPSTVSEYWLRVYYPGDANYVPASKVVKVTITNADLSITPIPYNEEYDGKEHAPAIFTVTGVGGAALGTNDYKVYFAKKEGAYEDKAPGAEAEGVWDNQLTVQDVADSGQFWYKIVADSYNAYVSKEPITVRIDPKPLTVTKTVEPTKEYDGTADAESNVTFTEITTDVEGETVEAQVTKAEYNSPNVREAKQITITYNLKAVEDTTKLENYTLEEGGDPISGDSTTEIVDGDDVAITPKPIVVAITNRGKVYDGEVPSVASVKGTDWTVAEGDLCSQNGEPDDLEVALSVENDANSDDVGTYAITGESDNDNYKVTFTGSWDKEDDNEGEAGTYTITHRPIRVQIGNAAGFYGDEPDVTMGASKVTLTDVTNTADDSDAGLVKGENIYNVFTELTLKTNAINTCPVGDSYRIYPAKNGSQIQVPTSPTQLGNYNVTFANEGAYTVKARPITITINDAESDYGCEIADLSHSVALTDEGEGAYTGTGTEAIVNEDNLGITLTTTAQKGSNAGTYPISGEAQGEQSVVANYDITWEGATAWSGSTQDTTTADSAKGTYTIDKAQLDVSVSENDIYAQYGETISNPVKFTNASTNQEIASNNPDYTALSQAISYGMNPENGLTTVDGSQNAEGKFTVAVTQQLVTVTVNVAETENYEAATATTYRVHASASGSLNVSLSFAELTYNGQPQKLLDKAPDLPEGVYIRYRVGANGQWTDYSDTAPENWEQVLGEDAGGYTVYWETTSTGNYNASSGNSNTSISKANLEGSFEYSTYTHVLATDGTSYNSATANPLTITSAKYTGQPDSYRYRSSDMDVAMALNGESTIEVRGSAGQSAEITVTVPGDDNYNGRTFTYTLEISDKLSEIKYDVTGTTTTYNGQPHTIQVDVIEPVSGATVKYMDSEGNYTLTDPPAYVDVKRNGDSVDAYTINFQITAPGYETKEGTATLTINPKTIDEKMVTGIAESYTYVNSQIKPETVAVVDGSVILKKDTDYTIDYGENKEVGTGSVTIKGTGNYKGEVVKYFAIKAVDGSDLTASLDRTFGYYGDSDTNNATVKVMHGSHEVTTDDSNTVYVVVTKFNGADVNDEATVSGQTITFKQVGTYTIEVTVTGNHATEDPIELSYALLPADDGALKLEAENESNVVKTYGEEVNGTITVKNANGDSLTVGTDYTLAYIYTPFEGEPEASKEYNADVMSGTPAAGMYVVTATGQGGYTNSVGTFTFLILQRDLAKAALDVDDEDLVFNHDEKKPDVTVSVTGDPVQGKDYTVAYYNNVNASVDGAKAVVTAKGNNFTGSNTVEFTIEPKSITECDVQDILDQYYTGNEVIPPVTITDGGYTLILGYDYTTACGDKEPGAAKVTITGIGNYTETTTKDFVIKSGGAPAPEEQFDLTVTPNQWTWGSVPAGLALSVTFGEGTTLTLGTDYTLNVKGGAVDQNFTDGTDEGSPVDFIKALKPGTYTITAMGKNAYNGSTDTETVTIRKIQPELAVTANPDTLSGSGKVTLTLAGKNLPVGTDLKELLRVTAKNDDEFTLEDLKIEWPEEGILTAELTLPNTSETYTFTLNYPGDDYYEAATASAKVVVAQQIISGGGGGDPVEDQPANPDDTGVSDWLNTKEHLAYLAGYPGGVFGPDQNMTRAEAAQMFYNLLLEKDVEITVEFEDVPEDAWYATSVNSLASLGILSGVGEGRFDPNRSITRAEFTVIAMKFANAGSGGVNIFSDVSPDDWFYSAVVDSTQYGWINGYTDGTFRPAATITRAEVTVIVNHMLGRAADREYVIAHQGELNSFSDVNRGHWGYYHVAEATNAHTYQTDDGTESWIAMN